MAITNTRGVMTEAQQIEQLGTKSRPLRLMANVASYVLHPMFMPVVMTYVLYVLSPISFVQYENVESVLGGGIGIVLVQIAVSTIVFPGVVVLVLKGLDMIQSIQMRTQKERIIPLIGTMVFYWWISHVFKSQDAPLILQTLLRGAYWSIIVLFICSIFFKISMHTMGAGGMLGILTVLLWTSPVEMSIPLFIGILVAGIIGTARLLLGAHTTFEVWAGYVLGFLTQLAAYWWVS